MSKLMTIYMVFDAVQTGQLTLEQTLPVSEWMRECPTVLRQSYLEVIFDPRARPASADEVVVVDGVETLTPIALTSHVLRRVQHDVGPGRWGMRWRWT